METRAQIITQLVSAFLFDKEKMEYIMEYIHPDDHFKPDYELAVQYANMVADKIIDVCYPDEIVFDK
jgi:hypothetical protein